MSHQNVVLIVVDSLRADRLTGQRDGTPFMPNLQRFASESWAFSDATAQATWTKPSVVSLLTSLYPGAHNIQFGVAHALVPGGPITVDVVPETLEMMAEYFRKAGFQTAAVQTNANLNPAFGFGQGFESYFFEAYPMCRGTEATDVAIARVGELKPPFFLYIHYMDPHHPYDPPNPYRYTFGTPPDVPDLDRALLEGYSDGYYLDKTLFLVGVTKERKMGDLSEAGREYIRHMYDGEVRFADTEVWRLIETVRRTHPDTIVVVTADHGEEFWEHGAVGHGKTVYQELSHVPLIISFPGEAPRKVSEPVELVDILPTLAARLGLDPLPAWQGRDLTATALGQGPRAVFTDTRTSLKEAHLHLEAVRRGTYKLIADMTRGTRTLYDLSVDPGETRPVENQALADELYALLTEHWAENDRCRHDGPGTVQLDDETIRQLRSQGYLR